MARVTVINDSSEFIDVMQEVVVALTVLLVSTVLLFIFGVTYTRWWLRKQLRIRPSTRSTAPTPWLVSTSEPARLHRRLRKAATTARLAGARGGPTVAEVARELEEHAIALEAHLVMTSRVWRREREVRRQLRGQKASALDQIRPRPARAVADDFPHLRADMAAAAR